MLKAFINSLASLWYGSPIEHGDKRRLWSYQSRSGGGYVQPLISAQKTSEGKISLPNLMLFSSHSENHVVNSLLVFSFN